MIKFDVTVHIHVHASAGEMDEIRKALAHITITGERIMSAISDFAAKQQQFNSRMDTAVEGLTGDVAELNRKIQELQQTPGAITPEDQNLLDELQQRGELIAQKLEALDSMTPPPPPAG
jgi:predicted  nucleic acid-binding Zn-ribbon protein